MCASIPEGYRYARLPYEPLCTLRGRWCSWLTDAALGVIPCIPVAVTQSRTSVPAPFHAHHNAHTQHLSAPLVPIPISLHTPTSVIPLEGEQQRDVFASLRSRLCPCYRQVTSTIEGPLEQVLGAV